LRELRFDKTTQHAEDCDLDEDCSCGAAVVAGPTAVVEGPAWVVCECCEDWLCRIHDLHAFECQCPGIEVWHDELGVDPYSSGGPPLEQPSEG
jgi:hypothetical protein